MFHNHCNLFSSTIFDCSIDPSIQGLLILLFALFLILNATKLTLFNWFVMGKHSTSNFIYKSFFFLVFSFTMFMLLFKIPSGLGILIFYLVESIYVFSCLSYYGYFRNYLHILQSAALFTEGVGTMGHMTIPVNKHHLILLIDMPVFIYLYMNFSSLHAMFNAPGVSLLGISAIILALVLIISETIYAIQGNSLSKISKDYSANEHTFVARYGTFVSDLFNTVLNNGGRSYISHIEYGDTLSACTKETPKPNIVCIQVESLDSAIVQKTHNNQYVTPFLHSLSKSAIYYPYTLSFHMAGGTSDSEFSIINGVEPLNVFPSIKLPKYDYPNSMIKYLKKNGYDTLAFHGNIGNFYNRDVAFEKMGFDEFYDIRRMGYVNRGWGAADHEVFDYTLKTLKEKTEPFISYVITMSSHTPFTYTSEYYKTDKFNDIKDETVRDYFTSVSYVDKAISDFVAQIRKDFPNTYIFIYGDHTPDINKPEYSQASYMGSKGDYFEFVPMYVLTPDGLKHSEQKNCASFVDIAPTILELTGSQDGFRSLGINLVNPSADMPKIPFKEGLYERTHLFKRVSDILK